MDAGPVIVMVAGPNGAGKSSAAPRLLGETLGVLEYVNADTIARGISAFNPDAAAVTAGRIMLERLEELARQRLSFAFETTGASRSFARRVVDLQKNGYRFLMFYIWVNLPDISVSRVASRVRLGGHGVPEETIRRRYDRGLVNFWDLYRPLADEWRFYDNSSPGDAILMAEGGKGREEVVYGAQAWLNIQQAIQAARRKRG